MILSVRWISTCLLFAWQNSTLETLKESHLFFSHSCLFLSVPSEHLLRAAHQRHSRVRVTESGSVTSSYSVSELITQLWQSVLVLQVGRAPNRMAVLFLIGSSFRVSRWYS